MPKKKLKWQYLDYLTKTAVKRKGSFLNLIVGFIPYLIKANKKK